MTGIVDVSPKIYLERLAAREAQIAARSLRVGHAGAKPGSHSGPNSMYAFTFPPYCNGLTRHVSSEKTFEADVTGSTTSTANGNQGFSPIDVAALANDTLTPANTPTTPNSIGLADQGADTGYVAIIEMGTPPRSFNLLADSGSADLWVGAEGCVSTNGTDCVRISPFCLSHTSHSGFVGKPRLSRLPILIFVSEYNTVFSSPIWAWGRQWNCHHRQCRHRRSTA
jgi:Eukaryotic aspartyl protease